jgi:hypothetical protein
VFLCRTGKGKPVKAFDGEGTARMQTPGHFLPWIMSDNSLRFSLKTSRDLTSLIVVLCVCGILSAAGLGANNQALATEPPETDPSANQTKTIFKNSPDYQAGPGVRAYQVSVKVYPEKHLLSVTAVVRIAAENDQKTSLAFEISPSFRIKTITQGKQSLKFSRNGSRVGVADAQVGPHAESFTWEYEGTFQPPYSSDSMEDIIVYADEVRLTFTSHWYPILNGDSGSPPPSSSIAVEVPEGFMVVSGDREVHPPTQETGRIRFEYASDTHGSLSFCAAPYQKKSVLWDGKEFSAYYFPQKPGEKPKQLAPMQPPQDEENVLATLESAKKIIAFYSGTLGSYPWHNFSIAQKGYRTAYQYGVRSYVVINQFRNADERTLAHEIAHQWWGNLVHPVGEGERWLTESLAEYSAFLYMQHSHGDKEVMSDDHDFLLTQIQDCTPIRKTSFDTPNYDNMIYHIGPYVYHTLRYIVGDQEFLSILRTLVKNHANRTVTVEDFIQISEQVHKESLRWFFDEWLDRTKGPQFILESKVEPERNGVCTVRGKIVQRLTDYRMPLRVEALSQGEKTTHTILATGEETPFEFTTPNRPQRIRFAEEMPTWILADFFNSQEEAKKAPPRRVPPLDNRSFDEFIQDLKKKVICEKPIELGTEIELTLSPDEAVLLKCTKNPYGLVETLICPSNGNLYHYAFFENGKHSGGGRALDREKICFRSHYGEPDRFGFLEKWQIKDEKAIIKYRIVIGEDEVKRAAEEYRAAKK